MQSHGQTISLRSGAERRRAVFLDRDGTLIENVDYPRDPGQVRLLDGVPEALTLLRSAGFKLVVVSNQSGIGRGLITPEEAAAVHRRFVEELRLRAIELDGFEYCPHVPDDSCACRKPMPGLLRAAAEKLDLDLARSFMVGDLPSDVTAGARAGCRTVLLGRRGFGESETAPDFVAMSWRDALPFLLEEAGT